MAVDGELLDTLCGCVDEAKAVLLSGLEREFGDASVWCADEGGVRARIIHFTVNEVVVTQGKTSMHSKINHGEIVIVIPIRKDDRADINVVVCSLWSMNYDGTKSTSGILSAVVRVVPETRLVTRNEV
jgi:hypothetical protein